MLSKYAPLPSQVWRVNGQEKTLLAAADQSKFYSGDCYIFQYSYPGEDKEDILIGTWFGKQSVEVNRTRFIFFLMGEWILHFVFLSQFF